MEQRQRLALAAAMGMLAASAGAFAVWQMSRLLYTVLSSSYEEAQKAIIAVTARINSDSPDEDVPEELVPIDDEAGMFVYEGLQDLYCRRAVGGDADWEWSYDTLEWYSTAELGPDHALYLDPPSMIFLLRLHLVSVARRQAAAAAAAGGGGGAGGVGGGAGGPPAGAGRDAVRIPPAVELPPWAEQQLQQQQSVAAGASWQASSSSSRSGGRERHLMDAPDLLCCPITGQIMLQPVTLPSGKTFEYEAVRRWITQHGSDPTTLAPLSLRDVYPNLTVREMVERWLATGRDVLGGECAVLQGPGVSSPSTTTMRIFQQQQQQQQPQQPPPQQPQSGLPVQQRLQQLQLDDSEDPLSSFGASGSSSSGSDSSHHECGDGSNASGSAAAGTGHQAPPRDVPADQQQQQQHHHQQHQQQRRHHHHTQQQ